MIYLSLMGLIYQLRIGRGAPPCSKWVILLIVVVTTYFLMNHPVEQNRTLFVHVYIHKHMYVYIYTYMLLM